jgi:hypothetical protein
LRAHRATKSLLERLLIAPPQVAQAGLQPAIAGAKLGLQVGEAGLKVGQAGLQIGANLGQQGLNVGEAAAIDGLRRGMIRA